MEYKGLGSIELQVSKSINAEDEKEAVMKLIKKFGTYSIAKISLSVELEDGSIHEFKVNDHEIEWDRVEEIDEVGEKEKSLRNQLNDQNK